MRQAINQYLKARKGFKLMERDDPMDVDFVHKEGQKGKGTGHDKVKGKPKGKSKGKGKQNQETFQGTWQDQDTSGANVGRKAVELRKQANNVGETEKTGDVNWIMMVQDLSVGQSSTSETDTWRCSGCKSAHESQVSIHAESDRVVPNPNVALHVAESSSTQQSAVDGTHQPDIRPESANPVNPVIFSNTAKLVVDSGCLDHCCPLEFATQFELKEGRFLNAAAANTIKPKHLRHESCRRLDARRERDRDSAQDRIQRVRRDESIAVDEQATKTRVLSLVGSANKPEERHHNRVDRPERVAGTGAEACEQNWKGR